MNLYHVTKFFLNLHFIVNYFHPKLATIVFYCFKFSILGLTFAVRHKLHYKLYIS